MSDSSLIEKEIGTAENAPAQGPRDIMILSSLSRFLTKITAGAGALVLFINVVVVFASVIWRYALHSPLHWAEEVARALMIALVFFGVATSTGRGGHIGVDLFLRFLPPHVRPYVVHASRWILFMVSIGLVISSYDLVQAARLQTTETGLPQVIYVIPVFIGSVVMVVAALEHALRERLRVVVLSAVAIAILVAIGYAKLSFMDDPSSAAAVLMLSCFVLGILAGVPIAFTLGMSAMVFFICDPSLPFVFFSQQVAAGVDHFVLLAIPFFLLAGAAMEVNGMSTRLVELIVRGMGKFRGGLNMTTVLAMAFFSGISGSKLADVAAVGGVLMPAVRRAKQDSEEAAGVFAASAMMAETIPPCVNLIVLGFVANISIGALFIAGLVPAACLLVLLLIAANFFGKRISISDAYPILRPRKQLLLGAAVGLIMILMIGRGVVAGIATSTEISAFAVVYALVVGRLAFGELTLKATVKLFVDIAAMSGVLLFIVACATSLSYALTIQMIPQMIADALVAIGFSHGAWLFLILTIVILIIFGAVLEGAPALIIFAPILVPIAVQLGFDPLHFGIVMVLAMGFGLFSPPIGLGLYTTCAICGVEMKNVIRPMLKYLAVVMVGIIVVAMVPTITVWLPRLMGY
ncbi:TRAP transporter large permease subunit [Budviciaceae bacterium CWB-B4]|uniref:TRAP transporter large permease subunit n=1 Tax=Limnobaculum xujianqingii TaxID=2738837 RepID=A0A9D7AFM1_9GAMM|nr:TRAP transporter large permease subunit [Limnobaculum xujianqingii]MBK5071802.1 TRAP transporter large permease subunit [Limnobaculum xujianqingii]MBK5175111.1 TRAP transporter large permease subunit [Limnobaculum xujianqingii]